MSDLWRKRLADRAARELTLGATTTRAAVAVVLRPRHDTHDLLLIRRAERAGDPWSGHMSLPGGRPDPADRSPLDTAIRETREEVGIDLSAHELWGRLDDLQGIAGGRATDMIIVPYVFALQGEVETSVDPDEVAAIVWADVGPLMRGEAATTRPYRHNGVDLALPGYRVGSDIVWGLTYRMLEQLFDVIRG